MRASTTVARSAGRRGNDAWSPLDWHPARRPHAAEKAPHNKRRWRMSCRKFDIVRRSVRNHATDWIASKLRFGANIGLPMEVSMPILFDVLNVKFRIWYILFASAHSRPKRNVAIFSADCGSFVISRKTSSIRRKIPSLFLPRIAREGGDSRRGSSALQGPLGGVAVTPSPGIALRARYGYSDIPGSLLVQSATLPTYSFVIDVAWSSCCRPPIGNTYHVSAEHCDRLPRDRLPPFRGFLFGRVRAQLRGGIFEPSARAAEIRRDLSRVKEPLQ